MGTTVSNTNRRINTEVKSNITEQVPPSGCQNTFDHNFNKFPFLCKPCYPRKVLQGTWKHYSNLFTTSNDDYILYTNSDQRKETNENGIKMKSVYLISALPSID